MTKYRFKTKEEFQRDDQWDRWDELPKHWVTRMRICMGKDLPDEYNHYVEGSELRFDMRLFDIGTYTYRTTNFVLNIPKVETKTGFIIHPVKEFKM